MKLIQIGEAVRSVLTANEKLMSVVNNQVYAIVGVDPEVSVSFPFISYMRTSCSIEPTKDITFRTQNAYINLYITDTDYERGCKIADEVVETMIGAIDNKYKGVTFDNVVLTDASEAYTGGAYIQTMSFQIEIQ